MLRGSGGEEKVLKNARDACATEIPKLADAVCRAEVEGDPSCDITKTGAGEAARGVGKATERAPTEGPAKGAVASAGDLAVARCDRLSADEINSKLSGLSQIELAKVDAYERAHNNGASVLDATERETSNA